jgi:hypothetical protein
MRRAPHGIRVAVIAILFHAGHSAVEDGEGADGAVIICAVGHFVVDLKSRFSRCNSFFFFFFFLFFFLFFLVGVAACVDGLITTGFQTLDSFEGVDRVCDRKDDLYFLN